MITNSVCIVTCSLKRTHWFVLTSLLNNLRIENNVEYKEQFNLSCRQLRDVFTDGYEKVKNQAHRLYPNWNAMYSTVLPVILHI